MKRKKEKRICACCGKEYICRVDSPQKNCSNSCGNTRHGMARHPAYMAWYNMRIRCDDPTYHDYKNYGGRGIYYDPSWNSFDKFWTDMEDTYQDGLTLDRCDNNKGYSKENCRWVPQISQNRNKRSNIIVDTPKGKMTLVEASEHYGISHGTLLYRYNRGYRGINLLV